ncbi:DUF1366 domain-containing protein [Streptococcus dysgalactiae]|uniref:DUF1366 domain-containing protein n=1 Tax=Streptococcus dysgalactiae TaxID=1334 RepID=UPI0039835819
MGNSSISDEHVFFVALHFTTRDKNFSQRAEDERFELLDSKIAESDAATNRANEAVKKIETQIEKEKKTSGTAQASILELITLLYFKGVISDEDFTTITSES